MKTLKFRQNLADMVLAGTKDVTYRLFDDKDIQIGDEVDLFVKESGEKFGSAEVVNVYEKKLCDLTDTDFEGHEKFDNHEQMISTYKSYYGDRVTEETVVKIIKFKLQ